MLKFPFITSVLTMTMLVSLTSCTEKYADDDFQAYFGGEITNPAKRYVLFGKDNEVLDTIPLNADNTFFKSFKSLEPGLYTFKHEPEYQYVYFDKNDSIMVRINSKDFDESIVFCGRGDQKNNFMMELFLRNEHEKNRSFSLFEKDVETFEKATDSAYEANKNFYVKNKTKISWSPGFDFYANAMIDYNYFGKREIYPQINKARTGNNPKIPQDFYSYRNSIDFNNAALSSFTPYITYISQMLTNMSTLSNDVAINNVDLALKNNINKLHIADTLIKNEKIKNTLLNSIAFNYLLEDQNIVNNKKFLDAYQKYATDKSGKSEIVGISRAISMLKPGNILPNVEFKNENGMFTTSDKISKRSKTIYYFWTENYTSHFVEANKKATLLKEKYPHYKFVAVNVDGDFSKWKAILKDYKLDGITHVNVADFEDMREKWAIMKIHRTIIVNADGTIDNAFTNLFNADFEQQLQGNKLLAKK